MRKLAQILLITLGCFSVAGVYASGPEEEKEGSEVAAGGEEGTVSQDRLFQSEEQSEDDDKPQA